MSAVKVIMVDNYDSFTYNLVHYIGQISGVTPDVFRNDEDLVGTGELLGSGAEPQHVVIAGLQRADAEQTALGRGNSVRRAGCLTRR